MNSELTFQIACKYPNARILYDGGIAEITCLAFDYIGLVKPNYIADQSGDVSANEYEANYSDCKLILKSLSDISEGDAMEVAKIVDDGCSFSFGEPSYYFKYLKAFSYQNNCDYMQPVVYRMYEGEQHGCIIITMSSEFDRKKITDYLRSKSYNIDNLPESVWVDEKSLT